MEARRECPSDKETAGVTGGVTNSIRYAFGQARRTSLFSGVYHVK